MPGVEAIIGEASDYAELAFAHLDATDGKGYLFGEKYGYNYARTKTPVGSGVAHVGDFGDVRGLGVGHWHPDNRLGRVFAVPLVVPK